MDVLRKVRMPKPTVIRRRPHMMYALEQGGQGKADDVRVVAGILEYKSVLECGEGRGWSKHTIILRTSNIEAHQVYVCTVRACVRAWYAPQQISQASFINLRCDCIVFFLLPSLPIPLSFVLPPQPKLQPRWNLYTHPSLPMHLSSVFPPKLFVFNLAMVGVKEALLYFSSYR